MPIGDLLAQITGETPPTRPTAFSPTPKRKAVGDLERTNDKQVKREMNTANISRPIYQISQATSFETVSPKTVPRPNASTTSFVPKTGRSTSSTPNGSNPATPTTTGPAKPPKKGSFAEIMARGKVAQATLGQVGKIQHKRIEKSLTKRERQELKEEQKQKRGTNGRPRPSGERSARDGQNKVRDNGKGPLKKSAGPPVPERKAKKAALATTGYTGTARPLPGSNKPFKPMQAQRTGDKESSSGRYRYASDEEDEEDLEEEEDYYSDASSDMEAAAFEVDEEEERAARIARKEDEDALREENIHKREKEEKRRMLAAMAKKRR